MRREVFLMVPVPSRVLALALLAGLCLSGACSKAGSDAASSQAQAPAAPDHLKALHASDLTKGFRDKGLVCKPPQQERDTQHWICESSTPLVQYLAEFYGKAPGRIAYIRVVVTQSGAPKNEMTYPLLGYVAGLKYEGADPEAARTWVEKNLDAGGMTEIGPAKLKLSGNLSRLVFELKATGSEW
jgi:hypothetical protein